MKLIPLFTISIFLICTLSEAQETGLADTIQLGKYTIGEWNHIIDTTWGEGIPTADKLEVFDTYWKMVDEGYAGFYNYKLNWDSIRDVYRPKIEAGVSKGRFAGILISLINNLKENHTYIFDSEVANTPLSAGIPMFVSFRTFYDDLNDHAHFGASVIVDMNDKVLISRRIDDHPLSLDLGDEILGYEGIPWKDNYTLLVRADFPGHGTTLGSSDESMHHNMMRSVGINWHLFDTIDIVKYSTGDTLHYPTSMLEDMDCENMPSNEQLPLPGIDIPFMVDYSVREIPAVVSGIITGTNIGYIFSNNWTNGNPSTGVQYAQAINTLWEANVDGLIIDLRYNWGGNIWYTSEALARLFDSDYIEHDIYTRASKTDHDSLILDWTAKWKCDSDLFPKPIAFLVGPETISSGDYTSVFLSMHPMSRSFGRRTSAAFAESDNNGVLKEVFIYKYITRVPGWRIGNDTIIPIHEGIDIDEEVWLTADALVAEKDNVVDSAINWMKGVAHLYNCITETRHIEVDDELIFTASIHNPEGYEVEINGDVHDAEGSLQGSITFVDDGTGGDIFSEDNIWTGSFVPEKESFFETSFYLSGGEGASFLSKPHKVRFTTLNRPVITPMYDSIPIDQNDFRLEVHLKNISGIELPEGKIQLVSTDSTVSFGNEIYTKTLFSWSSWKENIINKKISVRAEEGIHEGDRIQILCNILCGNTTYWNDTIFLTASYLATSNKEFNINTSEEISIFPVPVVDLVNIHSPIVKLEEITITTLNGQVIYNSICNRKTIALDLSGNNAGVYLVILRSKKFVLTEKIIKY